MPYSAIDIGSYETVMKIVEIKEKDIEYIEEAQKVIPIGREAFLNQKIEVESIQRICETLEGFKHLMQAYGVDKYKIVATSAFREASNRYYLIDQIQRCTGLDVTIISNSHEKYLMFKAAKAFVTSRFQLEPKKTPLIFLNIGYGNVQVTLVTDKGMIFNQGYKIGSLRILEVLADLEKKTINFTQVVDEYIESYIDSIPINWNLFNGGGLIVYGREIQWMVELIGGQMEYDYDKITERIKQSKKGKNTWIVQHPAIDSDKIELLLPTLLIIDKFLKKGKSKKIYFPNIDLVDGMIKEYHEQKILKLDVETKDEDLLSYVRAIGEKYQYQKKHADYVEAISLMLFDCTKKLHGIKKDRLLLQIATILHDIGKFISPNHHYDNTYKLIEATDIPGISEEEREIIAYVAKFHGGEWPETDPGYELLTPKTKLRIAKLASIITIANALDQSHQQKIKNVTIKLKNNQLLIKGSAKQETVLEQWIFEERKALMENVYGISVQLEMDTKVEQ